MKQILLFKEFCQSIDIPDSDILLFNELFTPSESERYLEALLPSQSSNVNWQQEKIKLYGVEYKLPRLTAWHGELGKFYIYSGIKMEPVGWTRELMEIKNKIESVANIKFNSVLLNFYRNGLDHVTWHSDDESELGVQPVIGSVSFGQERSFQLKHKKKKEIKISLLLPEGSFLLMRGETQKNFLHRIPKSFQEMKSRINLTFRYIL